METLAELATVAILLAVVVGLAVTTLVCARPRPCRNCRRHSGAHHRVSSR